MQFVIALVFSFNLNSAFMLPVKFNSYDQCMAEAKATMDIIDPETKSKLVRWACIHYPEPTAEDMEKLNPPVYELQ